MRSTEDMDFDLRVKLAVYDHFALTGVRPSPDGIAGQTGAATSAVLEAYRRLRARRVLVLEADGASIRMAPPFSGVPTQHVVHADGISYFANCAWDALGIPAALHRPAIVQSRCEQSMVPLRLEIGSAGPERSDWLFHCAVPTSLWWGDIVFT